MRKTAKNEENPRKSRVFRLASFLSRRIGGAIRMRDRPRRGKYDVARCVPMQQKGEGSAASCIPPLKQEAPRNTKTPTQSRGRFCVWRRHPSFALCAKIPPPCVWCARTPTFGRGNRTGFLARGARKRDSKGSGTSKERKSTPFGVLRSLEAPPGFGPGIRVLQTRALPLGHGAVFRTLIL